MDPVSQGVLGAAAAQAVARREHAGWAGLFGALSGMAPDLDVLARSASDPLLFLEYHRQFSHSLIFIPFGALLCAAIGFLVARGSLPFPRVYLFCLVGFATHGLLDACTSYGTQLFWPFSDDRVAWNNVSVVDPVFTLPLLVLVIFAAVRQSPTLARFACAWAIVYLSIGVAQRERAESLGKELARQRGHEPVRLEAKPSFGNLLLWKIIYEAEAQYFVDAARMGWRPVSFPGQSIAMLDESRDLPWLDGTSVMARDLVRFRRYSSSWVALDPARVDHVIDVRYSMVPNRIEALWGIALDRAASIADHAEFYTSRDPTPEHRAEIQRMLFE